MGNREPCATNVLDPGVGVGGDTDDGDLGEVGRGAGYVGAAGVPAIASRAGAEADRQAEGNAVSGEGEDLLALRGLGDVERADQAAGLLGQLDGSADGQGAVIVGGE